MPVGRRERNQQLFREVNGRIRDAGEGFEVGAPLDFVCECGDVSCVETIPLALGEYEKLPRSGPYFIVKPGHEGRNQPVAQRTAEYVLVESPAAVGEPTRA